jgi:hypothetical protein
VITDGRIPLRVDLMAGIYNNKFTTDKCMTKGWSYNGWKNSIEDGFNGRKL